MKSRVAIDALRKLRLGVEHAVLSCVLIVFVIMYVSLSTSILSAVPTVVRFEQMEDEAQAEVKVIYKDFCKKRNKESAAWALGSLLPFLSKTVRGLGLPTMSLGVFSLRQTYLLARNFYRNSYTEKGDLRYINHDVLEQLGNPPVYDTQYPKVYYDHFHTSSNTKAFFGFYWTSRYYVDRSKCCRGFSLLKADGIAKALSGDYENSAYEVSFGTSV